MGLKDLDMFQSSCLYVWVENNEIMNSRYGEKDDEMW